MLGDIRIYSCRWDAQIISRKKDEHFEKKLINDYNVYALQVPNNLDFAGEPMPLKDPEVFERMDRELLVNTYWQSNGLLMFKRAKKYFPIIEPILKKNGIPDDFKYLAVIESGLANATSPAGAKGYWQFMKGTAKDFDLEVSKEVDERYVSGGAQPHSFKFKTSYDDAALSYKLLMKESSTADSAQVLGTTVTLTDVEEL